MTVEPADRPQTWTCWCAAQAVATSGSLTFGLMCRRHALKYEQEGLGWGAADRVMRTVHPLPNLPLPESCLCRIDLHWDDSPEFIVHGQLWTVTIGIGCPLHYQPLPVRQRIDMAWARLDRAAGLR